MAEFRVRRDDLAVCELVDDEQSRERLGEGGAQLLVERFSLSANNITYAIKGEELGYWRLFRRRLAGAPSPPGATRASSARSPSLLEGQRVFGLVPMGTRFTVRSPLRTRSASSMRRPIARSLRGRTTSTSRLGQRDGARHAAALRHLGAARLVA